MFGLIDHIGVATDDLEGAIALYEGSMEMPLSHRETVEEQGVEAVLLDVGDCHVELLSPSARIRPLASSSSARGPASTTSPTGSTTSRPSSGSLASAGIELIDTEPRTGIRDSQVAFLHPRSTGGVLTEIVQPAEAH